MSGESILIIEDDPVLVRGLRDNFEMRGFQVEVALEGLAGVAAATRETHDLILLDVMLPHMNGYEICRAVRARGIETPIIMLTAKGQEEDIVRGLELGADDYVTKPFSIRELVARANAFLRRRRGDAAQVFRFGPCELNLLSHRLLVHGKEVVLTNKEFRLLAFMVAHPGRALTRKEIMRHVWGPRVIVTARSVDRCITTLRSKVEPAGAEPYYIKTIRDVGYRFEVPEAEQSPADT